MNTRRRMKIRAIEQIIRKLPRKHKVLILPLSQKIKITTEIPRLADNGSSSAEEFEKNLQPPAGEPETIFINGKPVQCLF